MIQTQQNKHTQHTHQTNDAYQSKHTQTKHIKQTQIKTTHHQTIKANKYT